MGSVGSPKALPWRGLLACLLLIAGPECQAGVQVSLPAVMEVRLGEEVPIPCTHNVSEGEDFHLVEWFITDRNGEQRRVAYNDQVQQGVDRGTEYKDRVTMDTNYSLVIKSVDVSDERTFSCQVTSSSGTGTGATQLKVYDPPETPEVTHNSGTLSVTGEYASQIATCSSKNANPLPTISWYKDGHLLNASTELNRELYVVSRTVKEASGLLSLSSTLYLLPKKSDKDSAFHCKVTYTMPHGEVHTAETPPFHLTLHYYTENVDFALESSEVIKEGDDVQLRCKADGSPPPEYFFFKLPASGSQDPETPREIESNLQGVLHLRQVTKADSGTYQCQALDFDSPPEVILEKEVTIYVHYLDPVIVNPSKKVTVNVSDSLTLSCSGSGSKAPVFSWRKGKEHMADGPDLTLSSVKYHMAGKYTCRASVPSIPGLQKEETVQVIVEGKPEMEKRHAKSPFHSMGETVKLTCMAFGHPEPEIRWSVAGQESVGQYYANRAVSELSVEVTPELVQSGVQCWAENSYGSDEQQFQFEIVSPTASSTLAPAVEGEESQGGSTIAVIAVCVCVLLLLLIVGFFYFMQRRGQLPCGGGEKRSLTPKEGNPDDTVVEMKTDRRNEQTGLLSHGGGGGGSGTNEC
uniref:Basal cell adhesion molecule n=1 Tax=Pogona vitticeps TaxID=103695 RepID=A0ABM5ETE6_9SAUR